MTCAECVRDLLTEINPDALFMDGFDDAIVGVATQYTKAPLVVYDRDKCLQVLIDRDGMTYEEADEYFSYNCEGAWLGENTPLIGQFSGFEGWAFGEEEKE